MFGAPWAFRGTHRATARPQSEPHFPKFRPSVQRHCEALRLHHAVQKHRSFVAIPVPGLRRKLRQ
jgi:hypothetical protein